MNPIDKIFSDELRDFKIKPSARADRFFEERIQKPERQKPFIAVAASVLFVLGLVWFLIPKSIPDLADDSVNTKFSDSAEKSMEVISKESSLTPVSEVEPTQEIKESETESDLNLKIIQKEVFQTAELNPVTKPMDLELGSEESVERNPSIQVDKINFKGDFLTSNEKISPAFIIPEQIDLIEPEIPFEIFEIREKGLLAKLGDEVRYILRGEKPDLDRSGLRTTAIQLAQKPLQLIVEEAPALNESIQRIKDLFDKNETIASK